MMTSSLKALAMPSQLVLLPWVCWGSRVLYSCISAWVLIGLVRLLNEALLAPLCWLMNIPFLWLPFLLLAEEEGETGDVWSRGLLSLEGPDPGLGLGCKPPDPPEPPEGEAAPAPNLECMIGSGSRGVGDEIMCLLVGQCWPPLDCVPPD